MEADLLRARLTKALSPEKVIPMRLFLCAALLLAGCAHIRSNDPSSWRELQSEHFLLRTDLPQEEARAAVLDLEMIRSALLAAGWHRSHLSSARILVVALRSDRELREFLPERIDGVSIYDTFGERLLLVGASGSLLDSEVVKHELTHALALDFLVTDPRWVQEGLACYLETLKIDRGRAEVLRGDTVWQRLQHLSRRPPGKLNWSGEVMGMGAAFDSTDGYRFETLSWALVHWLVDTQPERFEQFLTRLSRGENMWGSFNAAFPDLDEARVETGMHVYLLHPSAMRRKRLSFTPWSGPVAERSIAPAEVHALRAQLFRRVSIVERKEGGQRSLDAELLLSKASDPANPLALALTPNSNAKAAIDAHPEDWRSWVIWYDKNPKDASAIRKAAAIAPDNAGVIARLAAAEQDEGKAAEAIRHAEQAMHLSARFDVLHVLAYIYAANDRCADAAAAEERAIDALPDAVERGVPGAMRQSLSGILQGCGKVGRKGKDLRTVEAEPVLIGCRQSLLFLPDGAKGISAQFTIRENGSVAAVAVQGSRNDEINGLVREFVQSCQFDPVVVDGRARRVQTSLPLEALLR